MFLMAYLALMAAGLAVCVLLLAVPSKRRLALRFGVAILGSLPGILAFQVVVAIPLGILLAIVWGFHSAFHPPGWFGWLVDLPTILILLVSVAAASLLGCYTGGCIGWQIGAGMSIRKAIAEQKVIRFTLSWFRKRGARYRTKKSEGFHSM